MNNLAIIDILNPFTYIKDQLVELYNKMLSVIQGIITNPPRVSNSDSLVGFYANSVNIAIYLVYVVFVLIFILSLLKAGKFGRLFDAFKAVILIALFAAIWPTIVTWMIDLGTKLALAFDFYDPPADSGSTLPINDLGYILVIGTSLTWGSLLCVLIISYDYLVILFTFWAPIAYSVSSIGERAMKISNMILSVGLVATVLGRPVAVLSLEIGQVLTYAMPGGATWYVAYVMSIVSYIVAFASQILLFVLCYVGISKISGNIMAHTSGSVDSTIQGTTDVNVQRFNGQQTAAVQPMPVQVVGDVQSKAYRDPGEQAASNLQKKAASLAGAATATATAAAGFPQAAPAVKAGTENIAGGKFRGR